MRRGLGFAAAVVTAFSMVVVGSVVYALSVDAAPSVGPTARVESVTAPLGPEPEVASVPEQPSLQDIVSLAGEYLGQSDAYSIELGTYQDAQCYKITFSSGDIVYMGFNGEVLGVTPAPTFVASASGRAREGGGGGARVNEREDQHDEHESEHEGDD